MNDDFVEIPLDTESYAETGEFSFVLKPSPSGGIGVFATHGIRAGTPLRLFGNGQTRIYSAEQVERDPRLKRFCRFYGVATEDGWYVAGDFGCMALGWYLNHGTQANAHHDETWEYFASRDIAAGDEITIDYRAL